MTILIVGLFVIILATIIREEILENGRHKDEKQQHKNIRVVAEDTVSAIWVDTTTDKPINKK